MGRVRAAGINSLSVKYVDHAPAEALTEAPVSVPEGMSTGGGCCVM